MVSVVQHAPRLPVTVFVGAAPITPPPPRIANVSRVFPRIGPAEALGAVAIWRRTETAAQSKERTGFPRGPYKHDLHFLFHRLPLGLLEAPLGQRVWQQFEISNLARISSSDAGRCDKYTPSREFLCAFTSFLPGAVFACKAQLPTCRRNAKSGNPVFPARFGNTSQAITSGPAWFCCAHRLRLGRRQEGLRPRDGAIKNRLPGGSAWPTCQSGRPRKTYRPMASMRASSFAGEPVNRPVGGRR